MAFLYAPVLFVYLSVKRAKKCQRQALDYLTEQGVIVDLTNDRSQAEPKVEYDAPFRVSIEEKDTTAGTMKAMPQTTTEEYQFCGFCGAKLHPCRNFCGWRCQGRFIHEYTI